MNQNTKEAMIEKRDFYTAIAVQSERFRKQLMQTIAISNEFIGLNYHEIMKLPLKEFYYLLRIKGEEEKKKQEYLKQQQSADNMNLRTQSEKFKY